MLNAIAGVLFGSLILTIIGVVIVFGLVLLAFFWLTIGLAFALWFAFALWIDWWWVLPAFGISFFVFKDVLPYRRLILLHLVWVVRTLPFLPLLVVLMVRQLHKSTLIGGTIGTALSIQVTVANPPEQRYVIGYVFGSALLTLLFALIARFSWRLLRHHKSALIGGTIGAAIAIVIFITAIAEGLSEEPGFWFGWIGILIPLITIIFALIAKVFWGVVSWFIVSDVPPRKHSGTTSYAETETKPNAPSSGVSRFIEKRLVAPPASPDEPKVRVDHSKSRNIMFVFSLAILSLMAIIGSNTPVVWTGTGYTRGSGDWHAIWSDEFGDPKCEEMWNLCK